MGSSMLQEMLPAVSPLDLKALEEKVVRTIEVLNRTRAAKAKADEEIENLKLEVMGRDEQIENMEKELITLRKGREEARERVERMIKQIDGLIAAEPEA